MARKKIKKTAAQLNREIEQSLARTSHLGKPDVVSDEAIFSIAEDAFKEGHLHRGEQLVAQMQDKFVARCVKKSTLVIPKSYASPRTSVKRTLYRLYKPMLSFGTEYWWVTASTSRGETHVYPATEDGKVIVYDEIVSRREVVDHDSLMKQQGYRIVVCGKKLRRPRRSA